MLISIISHIIAIVGATVCLAAGLAIAGFVISMASSYVWRSAKAAYSLGYLRYTAKIIHRRSTFELLLAEQIKKPGRMYDTNDRTPAVC